QNVRCTEHLDALVRAADDFEALHHPTLNIYSFRYRAAGSRLDDAQIDRLNQRIADEIQVGGLAFLMTTRVHGRTVRRMSICSHRTTQDDIERMFEELRRRGEGLTHGVERD